MLAYANYEIIIITGIIYEVTCTLYFYRSATNGKGTCFLLPLKVA